MRKINNFVTIVVRENAYNKIPTLNGYIVTFYNNSVNHTY